MSSAARTRVFGYLLDTSVISTLWNAADRNHAEYRRKLRALGAADELYASVVSVGEVEHGLHLVWSTLTDAQARAMRDLMRAQVLMLPVTPAIARDYGRLRGAVFNTFGKKGGQKAPEKLFVPEASAPLGVQENDMWLLATAVTHNLRFVTADDISRLKDPFEKAFPGSAWEDHVLFWSKVPDPGPEAPAPPAGKKRPSSRPAPGRAVNRP